MSLPQPSTSSENPESSTAGPEPATNTANTVRETLEVDTNGQATDGEAIETIVAQGTHKANISIK